MLDKSLLGEAITRLRGEKSQRYVAKKARVPTGTWCQWEKGKRHPRDSQIKKIVKGLNCTDDDLTLEMWKIQAERFKLRGSEAFGQTTSFHGDTTLLKRLDGLMQIDLHTVPETSRHALRRLREIISALCGQIEPLMSEYEALIVALQRTAGSHRKGPARSKRNPDDDRS